jgi:hypothetical protein
LKRRTAKGKLKIEHRIIAGVRRFLERLVEQNDEIRSIIPGVIRKVRDAKGPVRTRITVPTTNGWKAIAYSQGQSQELFISTRLDREKLEAAMSKVLGQ